MRVFLLLDEKALYSRGLYGPAQASEVHAKKETKSGGWNYLQKSIQYPTLGLSKPVSSLGQKVGRTEDTK